MDSLITVLLVIGVIYFIKKLGEAEALSQQQAMALQKKKENCPPHKWVYRKQPDSDDEYMICDKCERFPLQD
jgi:hypothetical protein